MIKRYRCDWAMATKKRIWQSCNKKCKGCLCAITTDEWGREEHTPDLVQPCGNVTIRNLNLMSERNHEQQSKRR